MKIKFQAENPLEWIALILNLAPMPLVETQVVFTSARAIMAAADLGFYEAIGKGSKSSDEIAAACNTSPYATKHLLDALVGAGYLEWSDGKYSLKSRYHKWLLKESEANLIAKLRLQLLEWNWMAKLEDYVRTGQSVDLHHTMTDKKEWEMYQEGMRDLSINAAKELAGKIKLNKGATKMLDIGGSHGLYSIELCKKNPGMTSIVLDLPAAIESASAIAKRYDKANLVTYQAGDALTDDLGTEQYDLVMINNVVHHFSDEQNGMLAKKVAKALKPGGVYAIGDMIKLEKPGEGGVIGQTMSLYFAMTSSSGNWSVSDMQKWQKNAGLQLENPISLMSIPGYKAVCGRK